MFLFGKSRCKDKYINTCIQVRGLMRKVYIMPRRDHSVEEVMSEVQEKLACVRNQKAYAFQLATVSRRYCFELEVDYRDEEVDVVQLTYSYKQP